MAAVPSKGRATRIEGSIPAEASATQDLYERYASQIFGYCLHQLGSREEAEDAVQTTFMNAFRGLRRGIDVEQESAWLFKIAHNVCLSRRRSSWRRGRIESPADFELAQEFAPAPSRRADELMGLQDVLEEMPENQRRAILLREWQGLSYREIADELEVSQSAVETLIFRARRALAQGLEEPPAPKRRWAARGVDLGSLVAGAKSLFAGGAAVKVAAVVVAATATTVAASQPLDRPHVRTPHARPVHALRKHIAAALPFTPPSRVGPAAERSTLAGLVVRTAATKPKPKLARTARTQGRARAHAAPAVTAPAPAPAAAPPAPAAVVQAPPTPAPAPAPEHHAAPQASRETPARKEPPGQAKKDPQPPVGRTPDAPPRAQPADPPAQQSAPPAAAPPANRGQAKKEGRTADPSPPAAAPPADPAPAAAQPSTPADHGNNGNGTGDGKDKAGKKP